MSNTALQGGYDNSRFKILSRDGDHVNANVNWFSLRLDGKDPHAIAAILAYADSIAMDNPQLEHELRMIVDSL